MRAVELSLPRHRELGRCRGGRPGPLVLVVGGVHGNEPAGVHAAARVLTRLEGLAASLRGEVVGLAGNLGALGRGERFLDEDFNRLWTDDRVATLRARDSSSDGPEEGEQRELLACIEQAEARAAGRVVLLDLHTTSGDSPPFVVMSDTLRNRRLASRLPIPSILGLEESVDGTLLEFATERGHAAILVEAGAHADPRSVDLHESAIWATLVAAGSLRRADIDGFEAHLERLRAAARGCPRVVELRHRHGLEPGDGFRMEPGLRGFQRVAKGDLLARDRKGPVEAVASGLLLMPLYQRQGDDGFFLVRPVGRLWLALSALLRRLKLQVVLPLLPGVHRHPERAWTLRVDPRVARWSVLEVFRLFGYRRRREEGAVYVFSRRRPG